MSELVNAINNKNREKRARFNYQKREMANINKQMGYRIGVKNLLSSQIDVLLSNSDISSVTIDVPDKFLSLFIEVTFSDNSEMSYYNIEQVDSNRFKISKKTISI